MQQVNHSELRHRILSSLKLASAESVTALAQRLEVLRPSVSRAVKTLEDAGLVTRSGRRIILSPSGQSELLRYDDTLATKVLKDAGVATRVFGKGFGSLQDLEALTKLRGFGDVQDLNALTNQLGYAARSIGAYVDSSELRAFEGFSSLAASLQAFEAANNSAATQITESAKNSSALQLAESVKSSTAWLATDAFMGTAAVQAANLDLFKGWAVEVPSPLSGLISDNNLLLGKMVSDLEAFTEIGTVADQLLDGLVNQTLWTTKVYDGYFADAVKNIGVASTIDDLKVSVALPTQSMASLVGTTRNIVEAEIGLPAGVEPIEPAPIMPPFYPRQRRVAKTTIEIYLEPIGRRFVNKWRGAWQTFHSDSQDRHSQAAHSGRELLMQVLEELAPNNVFSKDELARQKVDKPTMKMRVKYILGGSSESTVELIINMADTMYSMYHVLLGEAHRRDDEKRLDDNIAAMLGVLENLLVMLLSMRKNLG